MVCLALELRVLLQCCQWMHPSISLCFCLMGRRRTVLSLHHFISFRKRLCMIMHNIHYTQQKPKPFARATFKNFTPISCIKGEMCITCFHLLCDWLSRLVFYRDRSQSLGLLKPFLSPCGILLFEHRFKKFFLTYPWRENSIKSCSCICKDL